MAFVLGCCCGCWGISGSFVDDTCVAVLDTKVRKGEGADGPGGAGTGSIMLEIGEAPGRDTGRGGVWTIECVVSDD